MTPTGQEARTKGRFITFEGGEGVGKTTQVVRLADHLAKLGLDVVTTREPGGTPEAEAIRALLLSKDEVAWDAIEEVMLIFAARHAHIRSLIQPALDRGAWVICDRFTDSTRAYQGYAHGVDVKCIDTLQGLAQQGLNPDRTIILDMPVDGALARVRQRQEKANRYDLQGIAFHDAVRRGFHQIADLEPNRVRLVDAMAEPDAVAADILDAIADLLPPTVHEPA